MQKLALGLYNVPRDQVKAIIYTLTGRACLMQKAVGHSGLRPWKVVIGAGLKAGLRHFDFASFYDNEAGLQAFAKLFLELAGCEAECGAALRQWLKEGCDGLVLSRCRTCCCVCPRVVFAGVGVCKVLGRPQQIRALHHDEGLETSILLLDQRYMNPPCLSECDPF